MPNHSGMLKLIFNYNSPNKTEPKLVLNYSFGMGPQNFMDNQL